MTAFVRRNTGRRFALSLVCGATLWSIQDVAVAGRLSEWSKDLTITLGQIFAPEPLDGAFEVADNARDVAATAAGAYTTSSVVGSSGPVILSTMKAAGGPIGAGAASGFGVAGLQSKFLYSDCDNSTACNAAAVSGYVGAGAGTAGAVALAASYGAGASGLAGIGALVGGGMAAGATTLIALPAVGAIAISAGVYGIVSWLSD